MAYTLFVLGHLTNWLAMPEAERVGDTSIQAPLENAAVGWF